MHNIDGFLSLLCVILFSLYSIIRLSCAKLVGPALSFRLLSSGHWALTAGYGGSLDFVVAGGRFEGDSHWVRVYWRLLLSEVCSSYEMVSACHRRS